MCRSGLTFALGLMLLALFGAQPVFADEGSAKVEATEWRPTEPMPEKFDWVMLVSGEWLKGEIISLYDETLNFESDELDTLLLDWEDVAVLKSHGILEVLFEDRIVHRGQLLVRDGVVSVVAEQSESRPRAELISVVAIADSFLGTLDGEIGLSTNIREGNSEQKDYTLRADATYRTADFRYQVNYLAGRSEVDQEEVKDSQRFLSSVDWYFSQRWFVRPVQREYFADEFQNIDSRITYNLALGFHILDNSRSSWDFYLGPGYQKTRYVNVEVNTDKVEETSVISLGTEFEFDLTGDIEFDFSYEGQSVSERAGRFNHHAEAGVSMDFLGDFNLDVRYILDRTQEPVADAEGDVPEQQDSQLIVGLTYEF